MSSRASRRSPAKPVRCTRRAAPRCCGSFRAELVSGDWHGCCGYRIECCDPGEIVPEVSSVQRSDVRAAIARASAATGVDFNYLLAQAKIESALDPSARARTSSAAGLYQFTNGTWLETLDRHGARHGLGWADDAIDRSSGRTAVAPGMRGHLMELRFDPNASALMAAELARDNAGELRGVLGREPDASELYLAHFLGAGGARTFLSALQTEPGQSAAALMPQAAGANRPIFYEGGRARSVGEVMDLMRSKVSSAMEGGAP